MRHHSLCNNSTQLSALEIQDSQLIEQTFHVICIWLELFSCNDMSWLACEIVILRKKLSSSSFCLSFPKKIQTSKRLKNLWILSIIIPFSFTMFKPQNCGCSRVRRENLPKITTESSGLRKGANFILRNNADQYFFCCRNKPQNKQFNFHHAKQQTISEGSVCSDASLNTQKIRKRFYTA